MCIFFFSNSSLLLEKKLLTTINSSGYFQASSNVWKVALKDEPKKTISLHKVAAVANICNNCVFFDALAAA